MGRIRLDSPKIAALVILCFVLAFFLMRGISVASPPTETQVNATEAQNPSPINDLDIQGGYKISFKSGTRSEGYYSISYKGTLVKGDGTPFKDASGLDLTAPVATTGSGDRNKWELKFEKGTTSLGGGLFEASGVQPLTFRGLESLGLRGTALVGGDSDAKKIQIAVGLESPPLRIPGFKNTQVTNWVVLGVNAQRQQGTESSDDNKNFGLLTYRVFIGRPPEKLCHV